MTAGLPWQSCNIRRPASRKSLVLIRRNAIVVGPVPLGLPSDESSWPGHGASSGAIHEDTEEETIILYDAPRSTTPPCTRYLFFIVFLAYYVQAKLGWSLQ
jgi:hypothetical protein